LAILDRMLSIEANHYYWAELVSAGGPIWAHGIAGEELSTTEIVQFDALARARQFALYRCWFVTGHSVTSGVVTQDSCLKEAAVEIASNPGFLAWWRNYLSWLGKVGRATRYDELLNVAIEAYLRGNEGGPN